MVLEMIGDLPEADAAPPSNMLFVCKLNPVTTEEDLEIIFGRWGGLSFFPGGGWRGLAAGLERRGVGSFGGRQGRGVLGR